MRQGYGHTGGRGTGIQEAGVRAYRRQGAGIDEAGVRA